MVQTDLLMKQIQQLEMMIEETNEVEEEKPDTRVSLSSIQRTVSKNFSRKSLMPDFNIYQCDLLGLKTNSRLMFKTSKLSKKFFSTLEKQKENLETLRYIFSAEIDKYDVK